MSATGLDVFDKTLQTTNIWLDEIMEKIGPDRNTAWRVLAVVLHRLRNRLQLGLAVNLGAQLPMLVRGVYYDQFQPEQLPSKCDTLEQFSAEVGEWLEDNRSVDPQQAVKAVFAVLAKHVSKGEIGNVVQALPDSLREAWPQEARDQAKQQMQKSAQAQQGSSGSEHRSPGSEQGFIGSKADSGAKSDVEPTSPQAKQHMVGGTSGSGAAR